MEGSLLTEYKWETVNPHTQTEAAILSYPKNGTCALKQPLQTHTVSCEDRKVNEA